MIYSEFFRPFIVIPFNTKSYKKIEIKFYNKYISLVRYYNLKKLNIIIKYPYK